MSLSMTYNYLTGAHDAHRSGREVATETRMLTYEQIKIITNNGKGRTACADLAVNVGQSPAQIEAFVALGSAKIAEQAAVIKARPQTPATINALVIARGCWLIASAREAVQS